MSAELTRMRKRSWRRLLWLGGGGLAALGVLFLFFPSALLNQRAAAGLTDYLVGQLGPDAMCAEVDLSWRSVVLRDVVLPLDKRGTQLSISRIEVGIDPLIVLSQPGEYERMVRNIQLVGPRLELVVGGRSEGRADSGLVPQAVFDILGRADSLRGFAFEDGQITLRNADSAIFQARGIRGNVVPDGDHYSLIARAQSETPVKLDARLDGEIAPQRKHLEIVASVSLAAGEIPVAAGALDSIGFNDAQAEVRLRQDGGKAVLSAWVQARDVEGRIAGHSIFAPEIRVNLDSSIVRWDSLQLRGPGVEALTSGTIALADSERLFAVVDADILVDRLSSALGQDAVRLSGFGRLHADISGTLREPVARALIAADTLTIAGEQLRGIALEASAAGKTIELVHGAIQSYYGTLDIAGRWNGTQAPFELTGLLKPRPLPKLFGRQSALTTLEFVANGTVAEPELRWVARDSLELILGSGYATYSNAALALTLVDPTGASGRVVLRTDSGNVVVSATNAHVVVPVLYPTTAAVLSPIEELTVDFQGDADDGEAAVTLENRPDSTSIAARIVRRLEFDGAYTRGDDQSIYLSGNWRGLSGEGQRFFGQGDITLFEDSLTISDFYIDEAGSLSGTVRIDTPRVDLSMSIDQLPLARLPMMTRASDKWGLGGMLSGELTATGPISAIDWYADVSLVEGEAQGVPGYWSLLTAEGQNDRVSSMFFSFGRGTRSIVEATGEVNMGANSLDVRVEFPTSDCADFIQALSGKTGLLSGDLDGEILIFGKLNAPEVVASVTVTNGELVGELTVNEFMINAALTTEHDGTRVLAVPQLAFGKDGKYKFTGELSAEPRAGGPFRAYIEGSGDFLNMLQQVDAEFTSMGSNCSLRAEVGGTWEAPRYIGGELRIADGNFTYPPATPGPLVMNALIGVNRDGVVDSGMIQVDADEDFIRLDMLRAGDPRVASLAPLVIPKPRIELGVFYLTSSVDGVNVRLPGFMKPDWLGRLTFGSGEFAALTISAYDSTRLRIAGEADVRDARFTFPFLSYGGGRMRPVTKWLVDRLYEAWWDIDISMGSGSHYDVEITGFRDSELFTRMGNNPILATLAEYVDHISLDAVVTPTETPLVMEGAIVDSSLRLYGKLGGSSGTADYLDQTFWVQKLVAEFDGTDIFPIISGTAETYGVDSVGRTVPVHLTIYEIDPETNTRTPFGRFEDVTYVLEADGYPDQEQVLGLLGYDFTNMPEGKAQQLLTRTAFTAAKRIWLDPISRKLERATRLDQISLAPGGGASPSIFRQQREAVLRDTLESSGVVRYLTGSNVTVGKYFTRDLFVTYTGELAEAAGEIEGGRLGLVHYWNLQYRVVPVSPDFVLDFAVEYDEASRRRDESVAVTYSFELEP